MVKLKITLTLYILALGTSHTTADISIRKIVHFFSKGKVVTAWGIVTFFITFHSTERLVIGGAKKSGSTSIRTLLSGANSVKICRTGAKLEMTPLLVLTSSI